MKRILSFFLICVLCVMAVLPVSAATEPLNPIVSTTQGAISAALGNDTVGAAVVIFENGNRVVMEGFGYDDIGDRSLVTATTVFELGNLSSLFVLLSVHQLAEEGLLDPSADISNYLSQSFMDKLNLEYAVTTNDLLYGAAGFEGRMFDIRVDKDAYCFETLEDALLVDVPSQVAEPGTYHVYSEFGIALAAFVVESVAHKSYTSYVEEAVLEPLGMYDTQLDPKAATLPETAAKGHKMEEQGGFAVAEGDGRSYGVLAPVNGAVSTAADMTYLLSHMMEKGLFTDSGEANGVFRSGVLGAKLGASTFSLSDTTACFGSALCVDASQGRIALVLTNNKESSLLALPDTLFGALLGTSVELVAELPDVQQYEGVYTKSTYARNTLLGRLLVMNNNQKCKVNAEGVLTFGEQTLRQVAPGVFALADSEENVAVLQFLTNEDGEVIAVLSSDGCTYLPVAFLEKTVLSYMLLILLILAACYFLGASIFQAVRSARKQGEQLTDKHAVIKMITWALFGTLGALTLLQVLVALISGVATFASFFTAFAVLTTVVALLAVISMAVSFFTSLGKSEKTVWLIINACVLVIFLLLACYWRILYIG